MAIAPFSLGLANIIHRIGGFVVARISLRGGAAKLASPKIDPCFAAANSTNV
jgi:hypothetical protein